jgi:hypothetical protein
MKNISRILMLASSLSLGHFSIASSAEPPKGKSITLGDLTFFGPRDQRREGQRRRIGFGSR